MEGDDLALVPADAQGFGCIRVADLWKTPAMQKAIAKRDDAGARFEQETGLRPEQVERLSGVTVDSENRTGWIIVRTLMPYDVRKVLSCLEGRREIPYDHNHYHVSKTPDGSTRALYFAGTRVIVAGTETGVKHCLDFVKRGPVTGPLEPIIALAAEGKHTAVAGVFPPGALLRVTPITLTGITQITATADVSETVVLDAKAQLISQEAAKKTIQILKVAKAAAALAQLRGGEAAEKTAAIAGLLDKINVVQKGNEIFATARIDDGSVAEALLEVSRVLR